MVDNELRTAFNDWRQAENNQGATLDAFLRKLNWEWEPTSGDESPLMLVWADEQAMQKVLLYFSAAHVERRGSRMTLLDGEGRAPGPNIRISHLPQRSTRERVIEPIVKLLWRDACERLEAAK